MKKLAAIITLIGVAWGSPVLAEDNALGSKNNHFSNAVNGAHRTAQFSQRDLFRHPAETLAFMGLKPDMSVVEISPGGGWYTEILAPYLREKGQLYAAHFPKKTEVKYYSNSREQFEKKLSAQPKVYDKVVITEFHPPSKVSAGPNGQADMVLTFRNVHNWAKGGYDKEAFKQFYALLKPGGVLGVVEHRARPGTTKEKMIESGYMTEDYVIALAQEAGFKLEEKSEINANSRDTADHPKGVWTLPPSLRLGDTDREKYMAIGESDRMTLRFRKPT